MGVHHSLPLVTRTCCDVNGKRKGNVDTPLSRGYVCLRATIEGACEAYPHQTLGERGETEAIAMKVFIAGIDGYIGWCLAQYLTTQGHEVCGADALLRRAWVKEMGGCSATPIRPINERLRSFKRDYGRELPFWRTDLRDYPTVHQILSEVRPEVIVHLAECPSAPYSMIDVDHAVFVQTNSIITTFNFLFAMRDICPDAHLVKLGSMGEYGSPNLDIPEGFFEIEYRGRRDYLPFPCQPGSWYHASKVYGSSNVRLASELWGLRVTDVRQGVVFGIRAEGMSDDESLITRFDFDQAFGTLVNRFCAQSVIGHPLTLYGTGLRRYPFIPLSDVMQCLGLVVENPPASGEHRVFNQFLNVFNLKTLALRVQAVAHDMGLGAEVQHLENPRIENERNYFNPDRNALKRIGYEPTEDLDTVISTTIRLLRKYRHRIEARREVLVPDIRWSGLHKKVLPVAAEDRDLTAALACGADPVRSGFSNTISVVIPAHNEAAVIGRTLRALTKGARPGELEIMVVCNGCTDGTAQIARSFGQSVHVIETEIGNKIHALNLGDDVASGFPRFYLDADVVMPLESVRKVAKAMEGDGVMAAVPALRLDLGGCSWPARAHYEIWQRLPYCRDLFAGTGVYVLNVAGRNAFDRFPDGLLADDEFVRRTIPAERRIRVAGAWCVVTPPKDLASVINVRVRWQRGCYDFKDRFPERWTGERRDYVGAVKSILKDPRLWPAFALYVMTYPLIRVRGWYSYRPTSASRAWERDETTRKVRP